MTTKSLDMDDLPTYEPHDEMGNRKKEQEFCEKNDISLDKLRVFQNNSMQNGGINLYRAYIYQIH
jgi:hypothetical protein